MADRARVGLFLAALALFSSSSCEIPQENTSVVIEIPVSEGTVPVKLTPGAVEGLLMGKTTQIAASVESRGGAFQTPVSNLTVRVHTGNEVILGVDRPAEFTIDPTTSALNQSFVVIRGMFLGRTVLKFSTLTSPSATITYNNNSGGSESPGATADSTLAVEPFSQPTWHQLDFEYRVSVVREHRIVDTIFLGVIVIIIVLANVGMGCKIDLTVIREVLRRPIPPVIGLACQYIIMPLLSFALVKILQLHGGVAFGLFATGCAPGGGASNMYTYLLKGDVSLSVTMTFISTMAALALIPFWLFTLGRVILSDNRTAHIGIPYANIIYSLLAILVPVGFGVLLERFRPSWSKLVRKTLRPVFVFFIVFIFTFGVYVNLFVFRLFTPKLVAAGILLPNVGFFLGTVAAILTRQGWARVKAIAVETGVQNTGVAYLILTFSLPQPEADLSMVAPIIVSTFTPLFLVVAIAVIEYRARCTPEGRAARGQQQKDQEKKSAPCLTEEEATFQRLAPLEGAASQPGQDALPDTAPLTDATAVNGSALLAVGLEPSSKKDASSSSAARGSPLLDAAAEEEEEAPGARM